MEVNFTVPGEPQGKARPRVTRSVTFTPARTTRYEDSVRYMAREAWNKEPIDKPCNITITAYFEIPRSYTKKRKKACLSGLELPTKKPDIDNIAKIVLDGLNPKMKLNKFLRKKVCIYPGLYKDDKQVMGLNVIKKYSTEPRIEVKVVW